MNSTRASTTKTKAVVAMPIFRPETDTTMVVDGVVTAAYAFPKASVFANV